MTDNPLTTVAITTSSQPDAVPMTLTEKRLAALCVELEGGGWTVQQTTNAMLLQAKVIALTADSEPYTFKHTKLSVTFMHNESAEHARLMAEGEARATIT